MRRPRTLPTIEANAGLRAELYKRIARLVRRQTAQAAAEVLQALIARGLLVPGANLAQDSDLSATARARLKSEYASYRAQHPEAAAGQLDIEIAERLARWMIATGEKAKAVSKWFVRAAAQQVTASQRRALVRAGISPKFLRERWNVPYLKNRYISPTAAQKLPDLIEEMTGKITNMQAGDLARLRETITEGLLKGQDISAIEKVLQDSQDFTDARAKRVALDQSNKVTQGIEAANALDLGCDTAIWVHIPGQYSSRETHVAMDGKRFKLSEGLFDSDVNRNVTPGELPFCRCAFRLDIEKLLQK